MVRVGVSDRSGSGAAEDLGEQLGVDPAVVFVFASPERDLPAITAGLQRRWPGVPVVGCTTMGELGPDTFSTGGVSAFALGAPARAASVLVEDLAAFEVADGSAIVDQLSAELGGPPHPETHVFVTLTDGLSGLEELLVASIALAAPEVGLVGGSAGDDFKFEETLVALGEERSSRGGVVTLIEPGVPFTAFRAHNFRPTDRRLVVTEADPISRRVFELDGRPGPEVIAEALGVTEAELPPIVASEAVFGFGAGDHPFLRSVMAVQDGALVMGGGVGRGAVLTLMRGEDLVDRTREQVEAALAELPGGAQGALMFWCGGRHLEATARGLVEPVHSALAQTRTAGFVTYGEHFGAQQVNHTLTALAFGAGDG